MSAAIGARARLGIGATEPVTQALEFLNESLILQETVIDTAGLVGSRSHPSERTRRGTRTVSGSIVCTPNAAELDALLPWILGGTKTSNTIPIADTLPSRFVVVDRVGKVFTYDGCKVASAQFTASQGGPLQVTLNLIGVDEEVGNAGTFPAILVDITGGPYILADCVLTIDGDAYQVNQIDITLDNGLVGDRFNNSLVVTEIPETDRIVTFSARLPHGDSVDAYGLDIAGVAVSAAFTNGTRSLTISMPSVQIPRRSPQTEGRTEIYTTVEGVARRDGTTAEISVDNDSTV